LVKDNPDLYAQRKNLILEMGEEIIAILKQLHSHGYVHGDIKPFNILYDLKKDGEKEFNLIDFGI
jgi:serine/threonine protein kinase